jgi:hypothetical protein
MSSAYLHALCPGMVDVLFVNNEVDEYGCKHQSGIVSEGNPWSSILEFPGLRHWVVGVFSRTYPRL